MFGNRGPGPRRSAPATGKNVRVPADGGPYTLPPVESENDEAGRAGVLLRNTASEFSNAGGIRLPSDQPGGRRTLGYLPGISTN